MGFFLLFFYFVENVFNDKVIIKCFVGLFKIKIKNIFCWFIGYFVMNILDSFYEFENWSV